MIIIVTGSREWGEPVQRMLGRGRATVWSPLDRLRIEHATPESPLVVRNGMARRGADHLVHEWCEEYKGEHVIEDPNPADWANWGNQAGFRRNGDMVAKGADMGLVWAVPCSKNSPWCPKGIHPTHGTADCVDKMRKADIPVFFCPSGMKW